MNNLESKHVILFKRYGGRPMLTRFTRAACRIPSEHFYVCNCCQGSYIAPVQKIHQCRRCAEEAGAGPSSRSKTLSSLLRSVIQKGTIPQLLFPALQVAWRTCFSTEVASRRPLELLRSGYERSQMMLTKNNYVVIIEVKPL
jgi:hypothetical protein